MIKYSIIIPTYKHFEDCLKPCLESIIKHTNLSEVEVIVVANGCGDDGTSQYVDSLKAPFRLVWLEEPSGYTHSTNVGIDIARGEYILLLNNDNIITGSGWLDILSKPFEDQMVGITGAAKDYHVPTQTEFLLFFCCMIPRRIFNNFGILDEAFNPGYGEDIDYCIKLKQAGYKVVQVPNDISISDRRPIADHTIQFPLWHKGSVTVHEEPTWETVVPRNEKILIERHGNKRNIINVEDTLDTIPYSQVYDNYSRIMESLPEDGLMLAKIDRRTNLRVTKSGFAHSLFTGSDGKYNLKVSDVIVDKSSFETIKEHVLSCGIKSVQFGGNWHGGYSTQQDPDEVSHFLNGIKDLKIKNYLEIGCADGGLTRLICDVVDIQNVTHVDIGWADVSTPFTYRNNLLNLRNSGVIDIFRGDSHGTQVKEFLAGKKFDFIFIDGDHSKEGVKLDTILATEHAEEGCIFAYHDIMIPEINEVMKELETGKFGKFTKIADFVNWNHPFGIGLYTYTPKVDYKLVLQQQDSHVYKEIFINNDYKVLEEEVKGKIVIDIGANVGMFAIKCMELGAKRVVAFEPEMNNYNKLVKNIESHTKITPLKCAITSHNDDTVYISNEGGGSKLGEKGEMVKTMSLSYFMNNVSLEEFPQSIHEKDYVLKMDCEGSEVDILLNLDDLLLSRFSTIYIELHPPLENILKVRDRLSKQFVQSHSSQLFNYIWNTEGKLTQSGMDLFIEKWTRKPLAQFSSRVNYTPKVSIIIPTHNHFEDCLKPCIQSIIEHTDLSNVEVIIVANGCTDGTRQYVESLGSSFKLIWMDEKAGYIKSTNAGIGQATGEYIILLNNDIVLLNQEKNDWINIMKSEFANPKVGICGPIKKYFPRVDFEFVTFFCVMLRKSMVDTIGLLDEEFGMGYWEDAEYCMRARCYGYEVIKTRKPNVNVNAVYEAGDFPIWHPSTSTFKELPGKEALLEKNAELFKFKKLINSQMLYGNNYERFVARKDSTLPLSEKYRYEWIRDNVLGNNILEIGCGTGYGTQFLSNIPNLKYLGIDYSQDAIDFATKEFGNENIEFRRENINDFVFEKYDTIIASEFIEHIPNGKELAQELKKHCKRLLLTTPYDEPKGKLGEHHLLHNLTEKDFPGFEYSFVNDGVPAEKADQSARVPMMLMKYTSVKENGFKESSRISIIIPTYNHLEDCLKPCIQSIIKHTNFENVEVVVVANGCTDRTREFIELGVGRHLIPYFNLVWIDEPVGFIKATNAGIKASTGDYIVLLNNDTEITGGNWLDILLKPFLEDSKVGITGPYKDVRFLYQNHKTIFREEYMIFYCAMVKKEVFDKVGLLDEDFGMGYEDDVDFSARVNKAGYKLVQVPYDIPYTELQYNQDLMIKSINDANLQFPLIHKDNMTFKEIKEDKTKKTSLNQKHLPPTISIVIPTYNHLDYLKNCVESIEQYSDLEKDIEIIIVANGCTDNTREYVHSLGYPFKLLWMDERAGYIKATNAGIKEAQGEYIILMNNDVQLVNQEKNLWLKTLLVPFLEIDKVGITGPIKSWRDDVEHEYMLFWCVMIKRDVIREIGVLDESFGEGYHEDVDFCMRTVKAGWKMVEVPDDITYTKDNQGDGNRPNLFPISHVGGGTFREIYGNADNALKVHKQLLYDKHGIEKVKSTIDVMKPLQMEYNIKMAKGQEDSTLPGGWFGDDDQAFYRQLFERLPDNARVVEIGVWMGRSLCSVADIIKRKKLQITAIDTFEGSPWEGALGADVSKIPRHLTLRQIFEKNIETFEISSYITIIENTSLEAAKSIPDNFLDFIFIDGDHRYEGVKLDIATYLPKMKANGWMTGHDILWSDEVRAAVFESFGEDKVFIAANLWYVIPENRPKRIGNKVYDVFMFNDELDILDIRLNELDPVVDKFILTEARYNLQGAPKPLYFNENKQRYSKFLHKIEHIIIDEFPPTDSTVERDIFQRNMGKSKLLNCNDNDIIILGDVDEIPRASVIKTFSPDMKLTCLELDYFYYKLNRKEDTKWVWARVLPYWELKWRNISDLRSYNYDYFSLIPNAGWHFSFLGNTQSIINKIESTLHSDLNTPENKDIQMIEEKVSKGEDIFGRDLNFRLVPIDDTYPRYVLDNLQVFESKGLIAKSHKVYDCFTFFNELDVLDIRLNELDSVVDKFVLCEAKYTHQGNPKPLYFEENKERYSKFLHKIEHLVIDKFPDFCKTTWDREHWQREFIEVGLKDCKPDDIIILSDADEIVKSEIVKQYKPEMGVAAVEMPLFYFKLDWKLNEKWYKPRIFSYKYAYGKTMQDFRGGHDYEYTTTFDNGGWHFSFLGDKSSVKQKIQSYAHDEFNNDFFTNDKNIEEAIEQGRDVFKRNLHFNKVEIDNSYPKYVQDNVEYYQQKGLICGKKSTVKVYDCFSFFNELHLLEIRLEELYPYVDYFVISEMTQTHSGKPKPLNYEKHKWTFEKYADKIIYVNPPNIDTIDPWVREHYQRDYMKNALNLRAKPEDIIIVSDLDEIPRGSKIQEFNGKEIACFKQNQYNYYLNYNVGISLIAPGTFSRITTWECITRSDWSLTSIRYASLLHQVIEDGGWHFSWMGGADKIVDKLDSWAHKEFDTPEFKDKNKIASLIEQGKEHFGRTDVQSTTPVQIDGTFPKYIQDHVEYFTNINLIKRIEKPKVAIIMPYYNDKEWVTKSVSAIMGQTFQNWELFIVDDGSDWDKFAINILASHPRIKHIQQLNQGPSAARNLGLKHVGKEFTHIAFCDSDDIWNPNYLEEQLKNIGDADMVYCSVNERFANGQVAIPYGIPDPPEYPGHNFMLNSPFIFISGVLCKRTFLSLGEFDSKLDSIEDWDMWLRVDEAGLKIKKNNQKLLTYTVKEGMAAKRTPEKTELLKQKHK